MTSDEFIKCFEEQTGFLVTQIIWMKWGYMLSLHCINKNASSLPFSQRKQQGASIILFTQDNPYTEENLKTLLRLQKCYK
jgi:hypothetical protein